MICKPWSFILESQWFKIVQLSFSVGARATITHRRNVVNRQIASIGTLGLKRIIHDYHPQDVPHPAEERHSA